MEKLKLADVIRMNQLVRGHIRLRDFEAWYEAAAPATRSALTYTLVESAVEAGVDADVVTKARQLVRDEAESAGGARVLSVVELGRSAEWLSLAKWLEGAQGGDARAACLVAASLFGVAEGRVYRRETPASCNHWWHRDLLDPRVEHDLVQDPEYFRTSMHTDERIKGRAG